MNAIQKENKYNPNPITKFFCTIILGFTVVHYINNISAWIIILIISTLFFLNGFVKDAATNIIWYTLLFKMPSFEFIQHFNIILKMFISLLFIIKLFYLPYISAKFLIKTSGVGTIITSMDKLKVPGVISIPLAVMFRFFPAFKEEKNNIKFAMKIRRITTKNPVKYIEYILIPLLILSSNISDDISQSAETKCIENPVKKVRYREVKIGLVDFIYAISILAVILWGWIC